MPTNAIFYNLLINTMIASVTNAFVWFALTFWVFLGTRSVVVTSFIAGTFAITNMLFAFFFGNVVDRHKKRTAMIASSLVSLIAYGTGALVFFTAPVGVFTDPTAILLWVLIVILMLGSVAGNLRMIALATFVTHLFPEGRDKANGMIGAVNGISFSLTAVLSGLAIGFFGMDVALIAAIAATAVTLLHLALYRFDEPATTDPPEAAPTHFDIRGTIAVISLVPGLFALIFFTTFNNFLGGTFMALMDAYGLSLVPVATWGIMFAITSFGFILGSTYIARFGLSSQPLRFLLAVNVVMWLTCIFFTIQPSVVLLFLGMVVWMSLAPFIEATEHTIIQSVVPYERQGRVFGFAQSIESAAMPVTAFLMGPIAQFIFIPFMTTGAGVALIGDWFGIGPARGIALVFTLTGIVGLTVTLLAFRSRAYRVLSARYAESRVPADTPAAVPAAPATAPIAHSEIEL